jgi:Flp pilus assembly protein TadG
MCRKPDLRRGVAAVEFAVLLPFLAFLFIVTVDWCRIFYCSVVVANCARNGAVYCSDPTSQGNSPYTSVTNAALADAPNLNPAPSVTSTSGTDGNGAYTDVTVSYEFRTLTNFPGVPSANAVASTIRVYSAPQTPR